MSTSTTHAGMASILARRKVVLAAITCVFAAFGTGCALRATTDFGPQSSSSNRSVGVDAGGFPTIPIIGNGASSHPANPPGGASDTPDFDR